MRSCDKGAGIIILNFNDYLKSCYEHLLSETKDGKPYNSQVNDLELERARIKIQRVLEDALKNEIISKPEFDGMSAEERMPGRIYCNFKVHKKHEHMKLPPVRSITSGSDSLTEVIASYVEHHIQHISTTHKT